jgi:exosortase/archaeosortase family protein
VFEFSNVAVQVDEVCSGIRSSLALIIMSVIVGHLFLRSGWNRLLLALSIGPITVFKNALRIVSITLLANYVDIKFVSDHWFHRSGGVPFFAAAMVMFIPIVWVLRKSERRETREHSFIA